MTCLTGHTWSTFKNESVLAMTDPSTQSMPGRQFGGTGHGDTGSTASACPEIMMCSISAEGGRSHPNLVRRTIAEALPTDPSLLACGC